MTTENDGTTVDLEELLGKMLDDRGLTADRFTALDEMKSSIDKLAKSRGNSGGSSSTGTQLPAGITADDVSKLLDDKLAAFTATFNKQNAPRPPALLRWLGVGN